MISLITGTTTLATMIGIFAVLMWSAPGNTTIGKVLLVFVIWGWVILSVIAKVSTKRTVWEELINDKMWFLAWLLIMFLVLIIVMGGSYGWFFDNVLMRN